MTKGTAALAEAGVKSASGITES